MAGVAIGDMDVHFAWHLATSTVTLCGRRGTGRHGRALCVAGVALIGTGLPLVARLVLVWRRGRRGCLRGRRGAWRHRPSLCVASVALGDMDRHFAWQAWLTLVALGPRLAPWSPRPLAWQAWHLATSTVTLRGRRGTWRHGSSLCVAGVALTVWHWTGSGGALGSRLAPWSPQLFAWQAWRLVTSRQQVNPSL